MWGIYGAKGKGLLYFLRTMLCGHQSLSLANYASLVPTGFAQDDSEYIVENQFSSGEWGQEIQRESLRIPNTAVYRVAIMTFLECLLTNVSMVKELVTRIGLLTSILEPR